MASSNSATILIELRELYGSDAARFSRLFAKFVELYDQAFPEQSEREDPEDWKRRLSAPDPPPQPDMHIVVAIDPNAPNETIGGIAFEFYRESCCGLLTYIVVDPKHRRKGIARQLLAMALERLGASAQVLDKTLDAIFAEAQVPRLQRTEVAQNVAHERLMALGKLGMRRVSAPYIVPPLTPDGERAGHLQLLWVPSSKCACAVLPGKVLRAFLHEFYRGLFIADPDQDPDYRLMAELIGDTVTLEPILEQPILDARDVALCLHFVESSSVLNVRDPSQVCPIFNSMELDLLSYNYQVPAPFQTMCLTHGPPEQPIEPGKDYGIELQIIFPEHVTYHSEGRIETRYAPTPRCRVRAYLSYTRFFQTQVTIWHVVLRPDPHVGAVFTEYDIIKLMQLYAGLTERTDLAKRIRFQPVADPATSVAVDSLVSALRIPDTPPLPRMLPSAGTLQWTVSPAEDPKCVQWIKSLLATVKARDDLTQWVRRDSVEDQFRSAVCGIISGIFDFDEIGGIELADTLTPTYHSAGHFVRVHRNTLVQISEHDRSMDACRVTAGISPYLIIPHSLMLFDEALLHEADEQMQAVLSGPSTRKMREETRELADRNLRGRWLPNVFNYETERTLFGKGMQGRGTLDRLASALESLKELESLVASGREKVRTFWQAVIAGLLALISVVQAQEPIDNVLNFLGASDSPAFHYLILVLIALIVVVLVFRFSMNGLSGLTDKGRKSKTP